MMSVEREVLTRSLLRMNSETPIFTDQGTLQQFSGSGWAQVGTAKSTIWLLQDASTGSARIVVLDNTSNSVRTNFFGFRGTSTPFPLATQQRETRHARE